MKLVENKIQISFNSLTDTEVSYFFAPFPWKMVTCKYFFDQNMLSIHESYNTNQLNEITFLDPNFVCKVHQTTTIPRQQQMTDILEIYQKIVSSY